MLSHISLTLMLKLFMFGLSGIHCDPIYPQTECLLQGTEVCSLWSDTTTLNIDCNCDSQCHWKAMDPRKALSDGSMLLWNRSTTGYGQFTCINLNGTTIRNVLIIPASGGEERGMYICSDYQITKLHIAMYIAGYS